MRLPERFTAFHNKATVFKNVFRHGDTNSNNLPVICRNCSFINRADYHFCTNCGYPVYEGKDNMDTWQMRMKRRKGTGTMCKVRLLQARNALYILATIMAIGFSYLFSPNRATVVKGLVMLLLGIIYAGLGRWSLTKPFTSLLIGLMIVLTFVAINTLTSVSNKETGFNLVYPLFIQGIFVYFLWRGVNAAFMADMLEEESKL